MERFTREIDKKTYVIDEVNLHHTPDGYAGEAIDKLAKFENVYESLVVSQEDTLKRMEHLRKDGKTNTVTFKQLMIKKLTNDNFLSLLKIYGVE